jgi:hypothetical protein
MSKGSVLRKCHTESDIVWQEHSVLCRSFVSCRPYNKIYNNVIFFAVVLHFKFHSGAWFMSSYFSYCRTRSMRELLYYLCGSELQNVYIWFLPSIVAIFCCQDSAKMYSFGGHLHGETPRRLRVITESRLQLSVWARLLTKEIHFSSYKYEFFCLYFFISWGGVRPSRVGTSVTNWPFVPVPDDKWVWSIWWNENWHGKPKYSRENRPNATLSITNPTWPDLGSNPSSRGRKLSYDTAMSVLIVQTSAYIKYVSEVMVRSLQSLFLYPYFLYLYITYFSNCGLLFPNW